MNTIRSALGFKTGLGRWDALAQADPDMKLGGDAMNTNMNENMEMTTFSSSQPKQIEEENDLESGGFFSSISSSINKLTGQTTTEPLPEPTRWDIVSDAIVSKLPSMPELSYLQRLAAFGALFCAGIFLLFYCTMVFPMIFVGKAAKFASSYIFANIFLMASSCFITSPSTQLKSLFSEHRRWVSLSYFLSTAFTLYACFYLPTMFIVLPSLMLQVGALVWYLFSYTPCGTGALNSVASNMITGAFSFNRS